MKFSDITNIRIDELRLPNALTLYYHQDHANPIVCLQLYIRSGSASETSRHFGYAHFLEHLVFKTTQKYRDNQISNLASAKGMVLNAYTDFDATCYYLMLPREELALAMDFLAQMAYHANFSEPDIQNEKDIIIEEINQYDSDPEMSFIEHIQATYFRRSPLSHPVLGSQHSVSSATLGTLKAFYRKYYRPSNAFLVVSGDIDKSELTQIFTVAFSSWMDQPIKRPQVKCEWRRQHLLESRIKQGQDLIALALPELPEVHPDSEALHVAIRHLAIGKSSLLHKELVETRKLCSYVKVSSISGLIPGVSVILLAPTQARHKKRILDVIMSQLETILHQGIPDGAMKLVKKDIIHSWLYSFDGVEHKADLIAAEVFNKDLSRIQSYGNLVQAIDNDHVISAVNSYWSPSTWAVYHQGPTDFHYIPGKRIIQNTDPVIDDYDPARNGCSLEVILGRSEISEFHHYVLPGGMKVVYNYVPSRPICGFALSSPLCQLNEKIPGQNYFSGALCLFGTRQHNHAELMRMSREKGLNIRVQHHLDSTLFRGKCHVQDLPDALSLLSEIVTEPVFDEHYLDILKTAALDSIRREMDFPASLAYNHWFGSVFGKNNNLLRATGEASDIKALTLADCISWYESWHLGRDFSLCIVGSIEPNMLKELCERFFSCPVTDDPPLPQFPEYYRQKAGKKVQYKHKEQSIVHIGGYACPASRRSDNSAFHVLAQILGGDLSSRMFSILRETHGYAYQTGFDFASIEDLGFWYAYAFSDPKDHKACLKTSMNILDDLILNGVSAEELKAAQNYLISVNRYDTESVSFRAATIANLISLGYDLDFYLQRETRIASTSLVQVHALAREWLHPDNRYIHVMV